MTFSWWPPLSPLSLNYDNGISGTSQFSTCSLLLKSRTNKTLWREHSSTLHLKGAQPRQQWREKRVARPPGTYLPPWNQPPMRLDPLLTRNERKSAPNSVRAYPTPETPSNTVEMEDENEMGHAGGWDTLHNMYAGQRIFGDVSTLYHLFFKLCSPRSRCVIRNPARTFQPLLSPINMRSERPKCQGTPPSLFRKQMLATRHLQDYFWNKTDPTTGSLEIGRRVCAQSFKTFLQGRNVLVVHRSVGQD
jgi:hypothetical protein